MFFYCLIQFPNAEIIFKLLNHNLFLLRVQEADRKKFVPNSPGIRAEIRLIGHTEAKK